MSWPGELVQTASVPRVAALVSLNGNQAAQDADGLYAKHREMAFGEPQGFWPYVSELIEFATPRGAIRYAYFLQTWPFFVTKCPLVMLPRQTCRFKPELTPAP